MARRIVSALTRAVTSEWTRADVHFHAATGGRAYPCYDRECTTRHPGGS